MLAKSSQQILVASTSCLFCKEGILIGLRVFSILVDNDCTKVVVPRDLIISAKHYMLEGWCTIGSSIGTIRVSK